MTHVFQLFNVSFYFLSCFNAFVFNVIYYYVNVFLHLGRFFIKQMQFVDAAG